MIAEEIERLRAEILALKTIIALQYALLKIKGVDIEGELAEKRADAEARFSEKAKAPAPEPEADYICPHCGRKWYIRPNASASGLSRLDGQVKRWHINRCKDRAPDMRLLDARREDTKQRRSTRSKVVIVTNDYSHPGMQVEWKKKP